jgi:segregation and condensation protein A
LIGVGAQRFAAIANRVLAPKTAPILNTDHLHQAAVNVVEQAATLVEHLRRAGRATFRAVVADAETTLVVVARFLALLELYREEVIRFEQIVCLGELQIIWIGSSTGEIMVSGEFDLPVQSKEQSDNV